MKNKSNYSRRKFIATTAKGAAVVTGMGLMNSCNIFTGNSAGKVPKRILGKTGEAVSILSFGGGSQFLKNKNGVWEKTLEIALESGINLFDTAPSYTLGQFKMEGKKSTIGSGEERFGEILPAWRDKVLISSKLEKKEPGFAKKAVEDSLRKLKTDYLDILLLHAINTKDNVAEIEKGVYQEMLKLKEEGIIKYIGFSSMDSAERSREMLEKLEFDVALLAMNPTKYGNYAKVALPVAQEKNVGVMTIKVLRGLIGKVATVKELFEYVWTTNHVASAMIGHVGTETLEENIKLAVEYGKNNELSIDHKELEARLAPFAGPHALPWARPGYVDGGIIV